VLEFAEEPKFVGLERDFVVYDDFVLVGKLALILR
jgi:hypothetical protein